MKYKNYNVVIKKEKYSNNDNVALIMEDTQDGEIITVCSVNIDKLPSNMVAIKDYGENVGILEWLIANGVVEAPHDYVSSGYVTCPICKLAEKYL